MTRTVLWAALVLLSGLFAAGLGRMGVPAAILLGPMLCAIGFGVARSGLRLPRAGFMLAQGVLGTLLAHAVTPDFLLGLARDWPGMTLSVAATLAASAAVGFLCVRFGSLPGSTAAWGSAPGAASTMVALAEADGADARLVAFMQYLRMICVVVCAALVSRFLVGPAPTLPGSVPASAALDLLETGGTIAVALFGSALGRGLGLPAGSFLVPLVAGAVLNATGLVPISPPFWLVAGASGAIGLYVGLQFERATLLRSLRAVPEILLASLAIIGLCGLSAFALARLAGIAPLTAFLATTPGAIETVALIALEGGADTGYVMATQTLRVLVVIATGMPIARWVARHAARERRG